MPGYIQISFVTSCRWHRRLWSFSIMEKELAIIRLHSSKFTRYRSTAQLFADPSFFKLFQFCVHWIRPGVPSWTPGLSHSVLKWSYRCQFQSNDTNRIKQEVFPNFQNKPQKWSNSCFEATTQLHSQFKNRKHPNPWRSLKRIHKLQLSHNSSGLDLTSSSASKVLMPQLNPGLWQHHSNQLGQTTGQTTYFSDTYNLPPFQSPGGSRVCAEHVETWHVRWATFLQLGLNTSWFWLDAMQFSPQARRKSETVRWLQLVRYL